MSPNPCDNHNLVAPAWPPNVPSDVSSWWFATGCIIFGTNPKTLSMPPDVFSWYSATASGYYASHHVSFTFQVVEASTTAPPASNVASTGASLAAPTQSPSPKTEPDPSSESAAITPSNGSQDTGNQVPSSTSIPPPGAASSPTEPVTTSAAIQTTGSFVSGNPPDSASRNPADTAVSNPADSASPSLPPSSSASAASPSNFATGASLKSNHKTIPIIAGVVVPLVLILLGVAAFLLYKRRQRARDRLEWERTHAAIADAVRQVNGEKPAAAAWTLGDVKAPLDGDTAPLFDKSGASTPGSLGHTGGDGGDLLSHTNAPSQDSLL